MPKYRYKIKSTGHSSCKLGLCEVCGQNATEMFFQTEQQQYSEGWTCHGCKDHFGHKQCLLDIRKD